MDANQTECVEALRRIGCSVAITSSVGAGFVDLVVGFRGWNGLIEIKDGSRPPSVRKLTDDEYTFHTLWHGWCAVAESPADCIRLVLEATRGTKSKD